VLDFLKRDLPLEIEEDEEFEIAMQGKLAHAHIRSYVVSPDLCVRVQHVCERYCETCLHIPCRRAGLFTLLVNFDSTRLVSFMLPNVSLS
jgi:hypothetical protein